MGHHFVPQAHLRRFECPDRPEYVWMYDKKRKRFAQVKIQKAAQSRKYYDQEVEDGLAQDIEKPANIALDKVMRRETLDNRERSHVSLYLLTMATRGPRQRRKAREEIAPKALQSIYEETKAHIETWIWESGGDLRAFARLRELEEVREKFAQAPPPNVVDMIRTPFFSEQTVECVHNMVWRILPAAPPTYFLTCDTPMHLSEWAGVGNPDSEITFPISKDFAVLGSHKGQPASLEYLPPDTDLVAEVNRRMVNCTERLIFSHTNDEATAQLADDPPPFNRINWV